MIKISDIIKLIKNSWKKIKTWYHHDRETKWYAIGFAVALWFYLLSENYAQVGYSWHKVWDHSTTIPIITTQQNLPGDAIPGAILEEIKPIDNVKTVKGGN
ncbi:MAG TPA: hypothetical protein DCY12_11040 [Candidatus Atribacteria bacterium]|nr:hypothetical protein [Candidatus Atribacteria bacterium]